MLDARLVALGAERLVPSADCDDKATGGYIEGYEPWCKEVVKALGGAQEIRTVPSPARFSVSMAISTAAAAASALHPLPPGFSFVRLAQTTELTAPGYDRPVRQFDFDLVGSGLKYNTGDHISILPRNDPKQVVDFLAFYGLDGKIIVNVAPSDPAEKNPFPATLPISEVFEQFLDLNAPPSKKFIEDLVLFSTEPAENEKLVSLAKLAEDDKKAFADFCKDNTYESILRMFPHTFKTNMPLEQVMSLVPATKPRLYSIASSSLAHPTTVQVAIVLFNFQTPSKKPRTGLCTNYLFNLLDPSKHPLVAAKTHKGILQFPKDATKPMIMFGLGTGIGVMRGFAQERDFLIKQGAKLGPCQMWQACRHHNKDQVYLDETKAYLSTGALTKHCPAFSHDQKEFITIPYVIDHDPKIVQDVALLSDVEMYYCGPAFGIPQAIMNSIEAACVKSGKMDEKQAAEHMNALKTSRWFVECYSA
jgi:sulfite reductase (NADPH) flavoprotein alpha-component